MTLTAYISIFIFIDFSTILQRSKGPRTVYDDLKNKKSDPQILIPQQLYTKCDTPATQPARLL